MLRLRSFDSPAFDTVGESLHVYVHFMYQCLQGIEFMHTHMVAHHYEALAFNIVMILMYEILMMALL